MTSVSIPRDFNCSKRYVPNDADVLLRVRGLPTSSTARRMGDASAEETDWVGRSGTGEDEAEAIASSQEAAWEVKSESEGWPVTNPHTVVFEYMLIELR